MNARIVVKNWEKWMWRMRVDGFFNLNRAMLALSLMFIILGSLGGGQANVSTMELVLFWGGTLSVFLFTTFIEIRNLISWLSK